MIPKLTYLLKVQDEAMSDVEESCVYQVWTPSPHLTDISTRILEFRLGCIQRVVWLHYISWRHIPPGLTYHHPQLLSELLLCWYPAGKLRGSKVPDNCLEDLVDKGLDIWSWMGWHGGSCSLSMRRVMEEVHTRWNLQKLLPNGLHWSILDQHRNKT